jgi:predicted RNA-binding protein (virulence factor B family)
MNIGQYNDLTILRFTAPGAYLGDDEDNDVLLPGKYTTDEMEVGDVISVFLYKDSEDRIVATTEVPLIQLGEFAYLKVIEVNAFGAFLNWGLEKDLMVPFKEQNQLMEEGKYYLVTLQYDFATDRLFASMKINRYLEECTDESIINVESDILVCDTTELGIKVIVNNRYHGIIYRNDISRQINRGFRDVGFVYNIREDGRLDVRLEKAGFEKFDEAAERILNMLIDKKIIHLSDKSDPDEIREIVGMSKKTFKQAIGKLYKARRIVIQPNSIELSNESQVSE